MNTHTDISSLLKRMHGYTHRDPMRDWLALLTLSIIALMGIIVWNAWVFDTIANGGVIGSATTETQPIFNHSTLDSIHAIFASRATEEAKYITGAYTFVDPSQ